MRTIAAVMTGKGVGAISTILLCGDNAQAIIKKIFKLPGNKPAEFQTGNILVGTINDGDRTIDHITLGCEGINDLAINCHGNPLIVTDIMQLLQSCGAELVSAEELLVKTLSAKKDINSIALEAKLALAKAKTIEGTKILANQINAGLNEKAKQWLANSTALEKIKADAERILANSQIAKLIIFGCKSILIGPANTGKSTLLNCLAGKQKAIVTDIKGTTRDWVSAECRIGSVVFELVDTAGLDRQLATDDKCSIEKTAQEKSIQLLKEASLVLLVLDINKTIDQLDELLLKKIADKKVLTVLNKCDLPNKLDTQKLPDQLTNTVEISAKNGTGIDNLKEKIIASIGAAGFNLQTEICVTCRQRKLIEQLKEVKSENQAVSIITELLNGEVCV